MKRGKSGKTRRGFWFAVECLCVAGAVALLCVLLTRVIGSRARSGEERASTEIYTQAIEAGAPEDAGSPTPEMLAEAIPLKERNADFVGMLGYCGMGLYVCQGPDNSYYASHRFDRSEDPAGMIYMDWRCPAWPLGDNTILYGHNMRDGSRFGKLNRLTSAEYLIDHPTVSFASLYEIHEYRPIAVFNASVAEADGFDFAQPAFADEAAFHAYLEEIHARSMLDLPSDIPYGTPLLTLATCSGREVGDRLVVVCALTA